MKGGGGVDRTRDFGCDQTFLSRPRMRVMMVSNRRRSRSTDRFVACVSFSRAHMGNNAAVVHPVFVGRPLPVAAASGSSGPRPRRSLPGLTQVRFVRVRCGARERGRGLIGLSRWPTQRGYSSERRRGSLEHGTPCGFCFFVVYSIAAVVPFLSTPPAWRKRRSRRLKKTKRPTPRTGRLGRSPGAPLTRRWRRLPRVRCAVGGCGDGGVVLLVGSSHVGLRAKDCCLPQPCPLPSPSPFFAAACQAWTTANCNSGPRSATSCSRSIRPPLLCVLMAVGGNEREGGARFFFFFV